MPNTLNYGVLERNLQTYMLRTDQPFVDEVPYLIERGIIRVYNNAKDLGFEIKIVIQNVVAGIETIQKPGNWKETISILMIDAANNSTYLLPRSYDFCRTYWNYYGDVQRATPKYYCDLTQNINNNRLPNTYGYMYWLFAPILDATYSFEIIYLGIPLFNPDNPTNFLTQRYPNLLNNLFLNHFEIDCSGNITNDE